MAAGLTQLRLLKENKDLYQRLNRTGDCFFGELDQILNEAGIPHRLNHIGSLGCVFFNDGSPVEDYESAQLCDTTQYTRYFKVMLENGIYLAPSQFEAMFLSLAHSDEDLERTLNAVRKFIS
jgi:glutamate-1-semialdehyde 2,1-aminomutase